MKFLRWLTVMALGATVSLASADTLSEYLAVRKKLGITNTVSPATLDALVGAKDVEVKGSVKGIIRMDGRSSLMVTREDGVSMSIRVETPPDWLNSNEVPVRMILKVVRPHETAELTAQVVSIVAESAMAEHEASQPKPKTKSTSKLAPSNSPLRGTIGDRGRGTSTSRSGGKRSWTVPASEATPIYAQFVKGQNPRLSDKEAYRIAQGVIGFSLKFGVDARLIMAMIIAESNFNPNATSHVGAGGLLQLMPGTAADLGVRNRYDSIDNLQGAIRYVRGHLEKYSKTNDEFDALVLSLAAYNAGPGAVQKHGGVPPYRETQNYVRKILGYYRALCGG